MTRTINVAPAHLAAFAVRQRHIPCSSRGRSPDNPARARQSPKKPSGKACSCRKIPAYSRSARKRQDRPVTPEVAGSSPVTRAEDMRPRVCGSTFRGCTTCAGGRSAASLHEKRDTSGTHDPTKPLNGRRAANPCSWFGVWRHGKRSLEASSWDSSGTHVVSIQNKNPRFTGVLEADEGTRTFDLLHGKCERPFAPVRSRSLKRPVCRAFRTSERTRANAEPCHSCHGLTGRCMSPARTKGAANIPRHARARTEDRVGR